MSDEQNRHITTDGRFTWPSMPNEHRLEITPERITANQIIANSEGTGIAQVRDVRNPSPHSVVEQRTFSQGNRRTLFPNGYHEAIYGAEPQTQQDHETVTYVVHATTSQGDIFASLPVHHRLREEETESTEFYKLQEVRRALNNCLCQKVWEYKSYPSVPDGIVLSMVLPENIIMVSVLTEADYQRKFPQRSHFQPTTPPNLNI